MVKSIVEELVRTIPQPTDVGRATSLIQVREEFRDVLFSRPAAGGYEDPEEAEFGFNRLFASAFAQTLTFGLLLARETANGAIIDSTADRLIPEGSYPLLRVTLQALLMHQVTDELGAGLSTLLNAINSIDPQTLVKVDGRDPILYFYEDFLATFDLLAAENMAYILHPFLLFST